MRSAGDGVSGDEWKPDDYRPPWDVQGESGSDLALTIVLGFVDVAILGLAIFGVLCLADVVSRKEGEKS